jgi:tetratricopeptide (TPR) repeat protein
VLDPGTAFLATSLLEGVVDRGTAAGVRAGGLRGPIAAKTGTTTSEHDLWLVGFTPEFVAVVWVATRPRDPEQPGASHLALRDRAPAASPGPSPPAGVGAEVDRERRASPRGCPGGQYFLAGPAGAPHFGGERRRAHEGAGRGEAAGAALRGWRRPAALLAACCWRVARRGARPRRAGPDSLRVSEALDEKLRLVLQGLDEDGAGRGDRALSSYERAIQIDSTNPYAYLALARHEVEAERWERALEALDQAELLFGAEGAPGLEAHLVVLRGAARLGKGYGGDASAPDSQPDRPRGVGDGRPALRSCGDPLAMEPMMSPKLRVALLALAASLSRRATKQLVTRHPSSATGSRSSTGLLPTHVRNPAPRRAPRPGRRSAPRLLHRALLALDRRLVLPQAAPGDRLSALALGFISGGAVGNLIDRIFRHEVVDFLHFKLWQGYSWPDFNVADSAIVVGVGLLLLELLASEGESRAVPGSRRLSFHRPRAPKRLPAAGSPASSNTHS